jgi:hypothetical protein
VTETLVGQRVQEDQRREETAREILQYLTNNPHAGDTLEGIARWWLERTRIERTVDEVRESLEILLDRGLIVARRGRVGPACYRMNRAKRRAITQFLK